LTPGDRKRWRERDKKKERWGRERDGEGREMEKGEKGRK
jgi:hypothetical protein